MNEVIEEIIRFEFEPKTIFSTRMIQIKALENFHQRNQTVRFLRFMFACVYVAKN